jgi:hypothetical protein
MIGEAREEIFHIREETLELMDRFHGRPES